MADLTFSNSGSFDGLDATLQVTSPKAVGGQFQSNVVLSQDGVEPIINIAFAIDTSGSTSNSTGIDLDGDGNDDTFLEAQIFAAQELLSNLVATGYSGEVNVTIVDYSGDGTNSFTAPLTDTDELRDYVDALTSGGTTPYDEALAEVESAWDANNVDPNESNFLYFFSDGFPIPSDQDFQTPLTSLENAYSPVIRGVGFGSNSGEAALDIIDSNGDAAILTTQDDLDDLLTTPPPLPDVESFDVIVDGNVLETIPFDDPRVMEDPVLGITISDLDVGSYGFVPGAETSIDFEIRTNFSNGESLTAGGEVTLLDGIVEGTANGDLIDTTYEDDPECDMVDAQDNIDPSATGDALDDDVIQGFAGNDTIQGGVGDDSIDGGDDADLFIVDAATDGNDTIDGGDGGLDQDEIDVSTLGTRYVDWDLDNVVTDSDGNGIDGDLVFLDGVGGETGRLSFTNIEVICFTPGTRIATPKGERLVEELKAGDRILTRDNGVQEIAWNGQTRFDATYFAARPQLSPILIKAGALGNGLPERDMLVSPQHRVLVNSSKAQCYFGENEVLVAAKHLVNGETVLQRRAEQATYIHFMCERHEVVLSDGAWTESFQPGEHSMDGMGKAQRNEIYELFPELKEAAGLEAYQAARRSLKSHEARLLVE